MHNLSATTLILIRHGEKDLSNPDERDPDLSEAGRERAQTLIHVLGGAGIQEIYALLNPEKLAYLQKQLSSSRRRSSFES